MKKALPAALTAALFCVASGGEPVQYWPKFPHPKVLYVTCAMDDLPPVGEGDPGGSFGALNFTLHSLAGLAAHEVAEGTGDILLWLDLPTNRGYSLWRDEVLRITGARRVDRPDPFALIEEFVERGVVKGYILYRADGSERNPYDAPPKDGRNYNNSANVATMLARDLGAVIVEEKAEPRFREMGLKRLLDVRDKTEEWVFENRRDTLSRERVLVVDPKVPHMRDYAVATGTFCIFGISPVTDKILAWLEPNAPAYGWGGGDEYSFTSQLSRFGHYTTASNWIHNLPAISTVRAGEDVPWDALRVNRQATVDPLALDWPEDGRYTSFVMSDGNNFMWFLGDFLTNESYWQAPSRGSFPFAWTVPVCDMVQAGVPALAHLVRTASPNDYIMMHDAGYFYFDEYAIELPNPMEVLERKIEQDAERMADLGIRVLSPLVMRWDSEASIRAYELLAKKIPGLVAILPIQYAPYYGGLGRVLWVENGDGVPIPVISARYGLWGNLTQWEKNGPPAVVAAELNKQPRGIAADVEERYDWTIVHAWSWFKRADTTDDPLAEEVDQAQAPRMAEAERAFEPVAWTVERLDPKVRVVTPEELAWRVRIQGRPGPTLDALAAALLETPGCPAYLEKAVQEYRKGLASADLSTPEGIGEAFRRLKRLRYGQDRP